jgi:outer membrane protein
MLVKLLWLTISAHAAYPLTLEETLRLAEGNNPATQVARERENAAESAVGIAKSGYYPSLTFEALETTGFPASSNPMGIGGIMGSPYRSGWAYGLVAQATLWDFGRTSGAVSSARHDQLAAAEATRVQAAEIDQQTAAAYFDCVRFGSEQEAWSYVAKAAGSIFGEVKRFAKTGQNSVVERTLAEAQLEQAQTEVAALGERRRLAFERLRVLTGLPAGPVACPLLDELKESKLLPAANEKDPWTALAAEQVSAAEARVSQAKAEFLPRLLATASIGDMHKSRLVPEKDSAAAIGVSWPIFEGFRTKYRVQEANAIAAGRAASLAAVVQDRDQTLARYAETTGAASVKLTHLQEELRLAESGVKLAQKRYHSFQGNLIDMRESLRNFARVKTDWIQTRLEYDQAKVAVALLNGARP